MLIARIDGHATSSIGHSSLKGQRIVLCTPINEHGQDAGSPFAALDPLGGGLHSKVIITTDGSWTQELVGNDQSPLRNQVMGIID